MCPTSARSTRPQLAEREFYASNLPGEWSCFVGGFFLLLIVNRSCCCRDYCTGRRSFPQGFLSSREWAWTGDGADVGLPQHYFQMFSQSGGPDPMPLTGREEGEARKRRTRVRCARPRSLPSSASGDSITLLTREMISYTDRRLWRLILHTACLAASQRSSGCVRSGEA